MGLTHLFEQRSNGISSLLDVGGFDIGLQFIRASKTDVLLLLDQVNQFKRIDRRVGFEVDQRLSFARVNLLNAELIGVNPDPMACDQRL